MGKRLPEHLEDEQMRQARLAKEQRQLEKRDILVNEIVEIKPEESVKEEEAEVEPTKEELAEEETQDTPEDLVEEEEEKIVKREYKKKKKKRGRPSRRDY